VSGPAPGHPEIERIVAPNPGPMTLEGTNTYVVAGQHGVVVIDPGPSDAVHLDAVRAAAAARGGIAAILLTHGHADHTEAVPELDAGLVWDRRSSGEPPAPFVAVATPGHSADHVCFVLGEVGFCGDLVLGQGSAIVPPAAHGGSLTDYMESLRAVRGLDLALLAPGHGPWITDPAARIDEYIAHRLDRERRLLEAIAAGQRSRAALLASVWDDVPVELGPAAAFAMQAQLEKLESEGALEGIELTA
jgi:glyoxylase-like metal-dependent hydrolase (beta-lactamase superfamily II)